MSIVMWNARGISRPSFKPNARHLIQAHSPDLMILVETQVARHFTALITHDLGFDSSHLVEPTGRAGGILLLWKSDRITIHILGESNQGVYALVEVKSLNNSFIITAVYASPKIAMRKILWNELCSFAEGLDYPWCVIGDFNEVTCQAEKFGGREINRSRVNLFVQTMNDCSLIDLGYHGSKFTWTNKRRSNPILERLDRGWANEAWITQYPNANVWHLPRITSDHCPIHVRLNNPTKILGPKPFRFEPMWMSDPSFQQTILDPWSRGEGDVVSKLEKVREVLVEWNVNVFGNVYKKKRRVLARLGGTQKALHNNPRSTFLHNLERDLEAELIEILNQEESLWYMKSRSNWVMEGERNTTYFHRSVVTKRSSNRILTIRNAVGEDIAEPNRIREHISSAFRSLYSSEHLACSWEVTSGEGEKNIAYPPTLVEISNALFSMKPLKAPGPDGFHPIFFQKNWEMLKEGVYNSIHEWFGVKRIPEKICEALICLIPKQECPETVKHYRPISLCNTIYKVVTKVLVNRLKPLIPHWISHNQNGFIKGRGTDVNLVVTSEILHSMHRKKGRAGWFALKIDLEKAYDRMEWSFCEKVPYFPWA